MYGIDFRDSTDDMGPPRKGGDWKMETGNDYDVAADFGRAELKVRCTETTPANKSNKSNATAILDAAKKRSVIGARAFAPATVE